MRNQHEDQKQGRQIASRLGLYIKIVLSVKIQVQSLTNSTKNTTDIKFTHSSHEEQDRE